MPSIRFLPSVKYPKRLPDVSRRDRVNHDTYFNVCVYLADYAVTGIPVSEQNVRASSVIKCLNPQEIEGMRKVCKIAREILDIGAAAVRPGITTDEIGKCLVFFNI